MRRHAILGRGRRHRIVSLLVVIASDLQTNHINGFHSQVLPSTIIGNTRSSTDVHPPNPEYLKYRDFHCQLYSSTSRSASSVVVELSSTNEKDAENSDEEYNRVRVILPPPFTALSCPTQHKQYPIGSFPNTTAGRLSVTSMNILAPFYHSLSSNVTCVLQDRRERVPKALQMAKQTNADILCLQEIEGLTSSGLPSFPLLRDDHAIPNTGLSSQMKEWLSQNEVYIATAVSDNAEIQPQALYVQGYDSFVWTPLIPNNQRGDKVGLCVAWRSQKLTLVAWEGFKRGMVCQFLTNVDTGSSRSTYSIANLHLPAKPSNILGRLKTMARTVRKLQAMVDRQQTSWNNGPLDGLLLIAGDWNSDQNSVSADLLKRGSSHYGNLKDRNYKAKVTKASALEMRHPYRFQDVYGVKCCGDDKDDYNSPTTKTVRQLYAPITVSLRGRGPGCMDHLFYARAKVSSSIKTGISSSCSQPRALPDVSKRGKRRSKSETRQERLGVRVHSVLATICGIHDLQRREIMSQGLPNLQHGYPSDHLPIGALFEGKEQTAIIKHSSHDKNEEFIKNSQLSRLKTFKSGVSSGVRLRRDSSRQSFGLRRRHNAVLGTVAFWLVDQGLTQVVRDQPLYKNEHLIRDGIIAGLTRKSRAPDLIGLVHYGKMSSQKPLLMIVEIAIAANPDRVRPEKLRKYQDLVDVVSRATFCYSHCVQFALVFGEDGSIPEDTSKDIDIILNLMQEAQPDLKRSIATLQEMLKTSQKAVIYLIES